MLSATTLYLYEKTAKRHEERDALMNALNSMAEKLDNVEGFFFKGFFYNP